MKIWSSLTEELLILCQRCTLLKILSCCEKPYLSVTVKIVWRFFTLFAIFVFAFEICFEIDCSWAYFSLSRVRIIFHSHLDSKEWLCVLHNSLWSLMNGTIARVTFDRIDLFRKFIFWRDQFFSTLGLSQNIKQRCIYNPTKDLYGAFSWR